MLVKFLENKDYNKITFIKGEVYDFGTDEDFANRWIKRGCVVVEKAEKVNFDPRFPNDVKLETPTEQEILVELPEVELPVVEEIIDSEEIEVENKPKKFKRGK